MPGLDPGIHPPSQELFARGWIAGPSPRRRGFGPAGGSSPAMTSFIDQANQPALISSRSGSQGNREALRQLRSRDVGRGVLSR